MKEYLSTTGGRHLYSSDIKNLQELALSMQEVFRDYKINFVISGCYSSGYSSNTGTADYKEGYVYIDGKIRHVAAATGLSSNNLKIVAKERNGNAIPYKDGSSHEQYKEYYAEYVNADNVSEPYIAANSNSRPAEFPRIDEVLKTYAVMKYPKNGENQSIGGGLSVSGDFVGSTVKSNGMLAINGGDIQVYEEDGGICFALKDVIAFKFDKQSIYFKYPKQNWVNLLSFIDVTPLNGGSFVRMHNLAVDILGESDDMAYIPVGGIINFAGDLKKIPKHFMLCDGRQLEKANYTRLYDYIGDRYSLGYDYQGNKYANPMGGYFRIPDLRGRFIVGYNPAQTDYSNIGNVGGEQAHKLTEGELAEHKHYIDAYRAKESLDLTGSYGAKRWTGDYESWDDDDNPSSSANTNTNDDDKWGNWDILPTPKKGNCISIEFETKGAGAGQPHENRPPFYTLAYIIRVE